MFIQYHDIYQTEGQKKNIARYNLKISDELSSVAKDEGIIGQDERSTYYRSPEITKAYYKLNKSIANALPPAKLYKDSGITKQIDLIMFYLSEDWLNESQKKAIKAILLISLTMENDSLLRNQEFGFHHSYNMALLILLLPFVDEILFNLQVSSSPSKFIKLQAFESLKKMFLARMQLAKYDNSDIAATDLALLARHNNLKSIRNAVSARILWASQKNPLIIEGRSARSWLTETKKGWGIKNRLIDSSYGFEEMNRRIELEYLNDFSFHYFQILSQADLDNLDGCPEVGVYLFLDIQSRQIISLGHSVGKLPVSLKIHFRRESTNGPSGRFFGSQSHLLIFEPRLTKNHEKNVLRCENLVQSFLNMRTSSKPLNPRDVLHNESDFLPITNEDIQDLTRKKITISDSAYIYVDQGSKLRRGSIYEIENTDIKCLFLGVFGGMAIATVISAHDINNLFLLEGPQYIVKSNNYLKNDFGLPWVWRRWAIKDIYHKNQIQFTSSLELDISRSVDFISEKGVQSTHEHLPIVIRKDVDILDVGYSKAKSHLIAGFANFVAAKTANLQDVSCVVLDWKTTPEQLLPGVK